MSVYADIHADINTPLRESHLLPMFGSPNGFAEKRLRVKYYLANYGEWDEEKFLSLLGAGQFPKATEAELSAETEGMGCSEHLEIRASTAPPEVEMPSLGTMASGGLGSLASWARTGFKFVSDELQTIRMTTCKACEFLSGDMRCGKCGCFMEIKSKMAGMKCPIGKW